jgi:hypothetical protein
MALGPVALGFPTARSTRRTGNERSPDWRANGITAHTRRDTGKTQAEPLDRTCRRCDPPGTIPPAGDGRECEGLHNPWNQVLPETQNHEVSRVAGAIRRDCATFRGRVELLPVREEIQHSLPPRRRGLRETALPVPPAIARWVNPMPQRDGSEVGKRLKPVLPGCIAPVPHLEGAVGSGGDPQRNTSERKLSTCPVQPTSTLFRGRVVRLHFSHQHNDRL